MLCDMYSTRRQFHSNTAQNERKITCESKHMNKPVDIITKQTEKSLKSNLIYSAFEAFSLSTTDKTGWHGKVEKKCSVEQI